MKIIFLFVLLFSVWLCAAAEYRIAQEEYNSEGSLETPVQIEVGEPYYGSAGPGGISYYRVTVERRADIYILVSDLAHSADLFYYGLDPTFEEWVTLSEGEALGVEDYFVEPGSTLHFSIVDHWDGYSHGQTYKILITEDFILSPEGIRIHGEIYTKAYELKSGNTHVQTVSTDGLNYYKTIVKNGPHLRIEVKNLPEHADLIWFDTQEGTYKRAYSVREGNVKKLEIYNIPSGSVCLYYVAANIYQLKKDSSFIITISEFSD